MLTKMDYNTESLEAFTIKDNDSQKAILKEYEDTEYKIYFIIKTASIIVVIICLIVMFSLYLYDRQPELCFYYSIGFSKKDIYLSILRKLLFVFCVSIVFGFVLSLIVIALVKRFVISPLGLNGYLSIPNEILHGFTCLILIFASLQLSIFFSLRGINTVDILEEEQI